MMWPRGVGVLEQKAGPDGVELTILGKDRTVLANVGTIPVKDPSQQGGIAYSWADTERVVFAYSDSTGEQAQNTWTLYSWNVAGGPLTAIAHNPTDASGHPYGGGWIHPYVTGDRLYWIQATASVPGYPDLPSGSELMQHDFTTGRTSVLYSGLTEAYVVYHQDILFTALPQTPNGKRDPLTGKPIEVMRAIETVTGQAVAPPGGITAATDHPDFIVTNGDLIVWDTGNGGLRGWRPSWGKSIDVLPGLDQRIAKWPDSDSPNAPRLWGPYLLWQAPQTYLLDLRTNTFTRLNTHRGSSEMDGSLLSIWQYTEDKKPTDFKALHGMQYAIDLAKLPGPLQCTSRPDTLSG